MVLRESDTDELQVGDPAPDFDLQGTDGGTYTLDSFRGSDALLVVFTCNHCPYAQAKFDTLNRLAGAYDDVAVVGINPNDETEYPEDSYQRMCELVDEGTIQYDAYLRDESQAVATTYGAACTPDPFLFRNEGGRFQLAYHGRLDDAQNPDEEPSGEPGFEMREAIESVLAGERVEREPQPARGCSIKWQDD